MRFISSLLLLWLTVAPAAAGQMSLLGAGNAGAALPGPPTFVYQTSGTGSGSNPNTSPALTVTATTANTRVYAIIQAANHAGVSSISACTLAGIACDIVIFQGPFNNNFVALVSASGFSVGTTSVTGVITLNTGLTGTVRWSLYEVDQTTLASTTPITPAGTINTVAATSLAASVVSQANGAVLVGFASQLITNGSQNMSATSAITQNSSFGSLAAGLANNVPANVAYTVTETWTTNGNALLGIFAFR